MRRQYQLAAILNAMAAASAYATSSGVRGLHTTHAVLGRGSYDGGVAPGGSTTSATPDDTSAYATHDEEAKHYNPSTPFGQQEHAYNASNPLHSTMPSGVPTRKGTEAAIASMRLKRMAMREELDRDREEMLRTSDGGNGVGSSSSSSSPSDAEVKAWRDATDSAATKAESLRQKKARDAFVREILGPAPTAAAGSSSTATPPAGTNPTRRGVTNDINKPKFLDEAVEAEKRIKYRRYNADGSIVDDGIREDPQAKQTLYDDFLGASQRAHEELDKKEYAAHLAAKERLRAATAAAAASSSSSSSSASPTGTDKSTNAARAAAAAAAMGAIPDEPYVEETPERLREAAAKFSNSAEAHYGANRVDNSQKMAMWTGAFAVCFLLVPMLVDPFGLLGSEKGGTTLAERERIWRQQQANVQDALTKREQALAAKQRSGAAGLAGDDDEEEGGEGFYSDDDAKRGGAAVVPSALTHFSPVMTMASYISYYFTILGNVEKVRMENAIPATDAGPTARGQAAAELMKKRRDSNEA